MLRLANTATHSSLDYTRDGEVVEPLLEYAQAWSLIQLPTQH
jgi:hypothetical protein